MTIKKSNLGQRLTKDQQRQIKGGSGVCSTSQSFTCNCGGATLIASYCITGNGVNDANDQCANYCRSIGSIENSHSYCGSCVPPGS